MRKSREKNGRTINNFPIAYSSSRIHACQYWIRPSTKALLISTDINRHVKRSIKLHICLASMLSHKEQIKSRTRYRLRQPGLRMKEMVFSYHMNPLTTETDQSLGCNRRCRSQNLNACLPWSYRVTHRSWRLALTSLHVRYHFLGNTFHPAHLVQAVASTIHQVLWRNRLARLTVNQEVPGSSPGSTESSFLTTFALVILAAYYTTRMLSKEGANSQVQLRTKSLHLFSKHLQEIRQGS